MSMLRSLVRFAAGCLLALTLAAGITTAPAAADDVPYGQGIGHGRGYDRGYRRPQITYNHSGTGHVRDPYHPSTRYVIPRHNRGARSYGDGYDGGGGYDGGYGGDCDGGGYRRPNYGGWSQMRSFLPRERGGIRTGYVRNYFLRRFPFALGEGAVLEDVATIPTLLAIGNPDAGSARALDEAGRLDRGAARFHVGTYDGARKDFAAVLATQPKEPRARFGLLMVAVVKHDWSAAARELDTLATAGELRADDRFVTESLFADASKLKSLTDGLRSTVSYRMTQAKAHVVTAWLLAGQGDATGAKRFVRLAKRWGLATPAVRALETNLGMAKQKPSAEAQPEKPKPAPKPKSEPAARPTEAQPRLRAPGAVLHREIAKLTRRGA